MKAEDVARVQRWADSGIASRSLHMNGSHDAWPLVLRLIADRAALLEALHLVRKRERLGRYTLDEVIYTLDEVIAALESAEAE